VQKWDTIVVLNLRLFPNMFLLERQVRQVCTHSCRAGRVAGISLPSFADNDGSFAEMQARIDKIVDFLKGPRADQFDGKEDTVITVPMGGQLREFKCQNYLYHFAMDGTRRQTHGRPDAHPDKACVFYGRRMPLVELIRRRM
jgi:hypothetical protein